MDDLFSIQTVDSKPVHGNSGRFFSGNRGHEIDGFYQTPENKTSYLGLSLNLRLLNFFIILMSFVFLIFAVRIFYLQIFKGNYYESLAEGNRIRIETVYPKRGLILDRNNKKLVENVPQLILALQTDALLRGDAERERLIQLLLPYIPRNIIEDEIATVRESSWISLKENLTHDEAVFFAAKFSYEPSLSVRYVNRRKYITSDTQSMSHILGYMGKLTKEEYENYKNIYPFDARIGKNGLELIYEDVLRGVFGRKHIEVDAMGQEKQIIAKEEPVDGKNIKLSVDYDLQKKTEEVLKTYLEKFNKKKASIIIMDPRNGEVLTLVSWPSFDNNKFELGISQEEYSSLINNEDQPLFNRSVSGEYPSGSTIKPVFSTAALEEKVITDKTTVNSVGGIYVGSWFFPDWKAGGHGITNVYKAIAESVNTFFYCIGGGCGSIDGLGVDRLGKWAEKFGFGRKSNIDLPGEAEGFIPTAEWKKNLRDESWYIGDTYHYSIGQGDFTVTPIQIVQATSAIANGGTIFKPHLVQSVSDSKGNVEDVKSEVVTQNIASSENLKTVRDGMRRTVTDGSARYLGTLDVAVAGKTGTAQWNSNEPNHAWFTGFAPFENPQVVITVLVEAGGEGSSVSVPIAKDILAWYFSNIKQ